MIEPPGEGPGRALGAPRPALGEILGGEAVIRAEEFALARGQGQQPAVGHLEEDGLLSDVKQAGEHLRVQRAVNDGVFIIERRSVPRVLHVVVEERIHDVLRHEAAEVGVFPGQVVFVGGLLPAAARLVDGVDHVRLLRAPGTEDAPEHGSLTAVLLIGITAEGDEGVAVLRVSSGLPVIAGEPCGKPCGGEHNAGDDEEAGA